MRHRYRVQTRRIRPIAFDIAKMYYVVGGRFVATVLPGNSLEVPVPVPVPVSQASKRQAGEVLLFVRTTQRGRLARAAYVAYVASAREGRGLHGQRRRHHVR